MPDPNFERSLKISLARFGLELTCSAMQRWCLGETYSRFGRILGRRAAVAALLALNFVVGPTRVAHADDEEEAQDDVEQADLPWIRARFGAERWIEALASTPERRLAAVRRLVAQATPQSERVLINWLVRRPPIAAGERLELVRALSNVTLEPVQFWMFHVIAESSAEAEVAPDESARRVAELSGRAAALSLAQQRTAAGLTLLGRALARGGLPAEFAKSALLAAPPADLAPLLESSPKPSIALVLALDELGDQRAFLPLREFVRRGTPSIQAAAARALLHLGALETVTLAHYWEARPALPAELVRVSTEILLQADPEHAAALFSRLLSSDADAAIQLFHAAPADSAVAALLEAFAGMSDAQRSGTLVALGRSPSPNAAAFLGTQLDGPLATAAAEALVTSPAEATERVLEAALRAPRSSALAAQAWLLRQAARGKGEAPPWLVRWSESTQQPSRSIGLWGRALLDTDFAQRGVTQRSGADLRAIAAAAFAQPDAFFAAAGKRLGEPELPALTLAALASVAAQPLATARVSSARLQTWLDQPELLYTATRELVARRQAGQAELMQRALGSTDAKLRIAAYRGLGSHPDRELSAVLVQAYYREPDAKARLAVLASLAERGAPLPHGLLRDARQLDPDASIREAAGWVAAGMPLALDRQPIVTGKPETWPVRLAPSGPMVNSSGRFPESRREESEGTSSATPPGRETPP